MPTSILGAAILGDVVLAGLDAPGSSFDQLVEQTLALVDVATHPEIYEELVEDVLDFLEDTGHNNFFDASASDTIVFVEDQQETSLENAILQSISFAQEALGDTNSFPRFVNDSLAFVEQASGHGPQGIAFSQSMILSQTATFTRPVVSKQVSDFIPFVISVGKHQPKSAADTMVLVDAAEVKYIGENVLTFVETIDAGKGNTFGDTMSLVSSGTYAGSTFNRTFPQSLGLHDAVSYFVEGINVLCQYYPFVGSSDDPDAPEPPSLELPGPNLDVTEPFQLFYPVVDPEDYVTLRAPDLGNRDKLSMNRVNRRTRGGTLVIFADPQWPKTQTLELNFSVLHAEEAQALLTFLQTHLGQEIGLLDWEKRYWQGVVTDVTGVITQNGFDDYSATFTFEGELSDENPPLVTSDFVCSGESRAAQNKGHDLACACDSGHGVPIEALPPYTSETDSSTLIGSPLYLKLSTHVDLAQANDAGTTQVVGFAIEAVSPLFAVEYISEGQITRDDWTSIAGTVFLSVGSQYYLSPSTAGRITSTAPTTAGQYVVPVGRAISDKVLDIEIGQSVKL